jgi:hypothetical protein
VRRSLGLLVLVAAVVLTAGASAAPARDPVLQSTFASAGHIVVTFSVGNLVPATIAVATQPDRVTGGSFVHDNIRLQERVVAKVDPATGMARFRTRGMVARGVYYVAVSGVLEDPPPSCFPLRSHCAMRWSNMLQVAVRPESVP